MSFSQIFQSIRMPRTLAYATLMIVFARTESADAQVARQVIPRSDPAPVVQDAGVPPVELNPPRLDLGNVQRGVTAEGQVELINTSDHPIRIAKASASCGCTVAQLTQQEIPAGQSGTAIIRFRPSGAAGARAGQTVRFLVEGFAKPLTLSVAAIVSEFVEVLPSSIDASAISSTPVEIRATDDKSFQIVPSDLLETLTDENATSQTVRVVMDKWLKAGSPKRIVIGTTHPHAKEVVLQIKDVKSVVSPSRTSSTSSHSLKIPHQTTSSLMQVFPRRVNFGTVSPDKPARRELFLRATVQDEQPAPTVSIEDREAVRATVVDWRQDRGGIVLVVELSTTASTIDQTVAELNVQYGSLRGATNIYYSAR